MLQLKTKKQLEGEAHTLAQGLELVRWRATTYIPADFETLNVATPPDPDRKIWLPMDREDIMQLAAERFSTLFASDGELASFDFMVAQNSKRLQGDAREVLVRTPEGLRSLNDSGELTPVSTGFVPNTVKPMLNNDPADRARMLAVLHQWVDDMDEVTSLLHHLATCLAPHYSAVKYVILLGEGRNGKSLLLKMLQALFGIENVSHVTRQQISENSPVVTDLNGKLMNIVFDGQAVFLKDSGTEKSLIAGEPTPIRKLYESTPTIVRSNALFVEGLNREPKSSDKSTALQKRIVRFEFPNVFDLDHEFEEEMLSEKMLGAFLSLLIDHYVPKGSMAKMLAPTSKALELQLEHMYVNSAELQFLAHLDNQGSIPTLLGMDIREAVKRYQSWRLKMNDLGTYSEPDVITKLKTIFNTERKSVRLAEGPRKITVITSIKPEAQTFLDAQKGDDEDAALLESLVGE